MDRFDSHTLDTAPDAARSMLAQYAQPDGQLPGLLSVMAESPALLGAYLDVYKRFELGSLSAAEQQVVALTAGFENECHYCVAAHTAAGLKAGLTAGTVEALRNGHRPADQRLRALHRFTRTVLLKRGFVDNAEVTEFLDAGFSKANLLDVILGIGMKVLSTYTNHLAHTPLDAALKPYAWTTPDQRQVA